jgi:hypothetical protein
MVAGRKPYDLGVSRRTAILVLLCAAGLAAAGLAGRGSGGKATPAAGGPDSRTQPLLDGCTRDRVAILTKTAPNWVYVDGGLAQNQALNGVVDSQFQPDRAAEPTGTDDPFTHTSYDFTFNVKPDPQYENLLGTGNFEGTSEETARLHIERESATFPMWAWPDRGDRISLIGSWVWDCDHTTAAGEHTEIHPFRVLWVERNPGGGSASSSTGDREADLFITNESTPADTQAVCAHETKGDSTAFKQCVNELPLPIAALHAPLSFTLEAPRKPSPRGHLVYDMVRRMPCCAKISVKKGADRITVTVAPTLSAQASFFVGWRPVKKPPVHLRVRLISLHVRRAMDPGCPPYDPTCPVQNESTLLGQVTTSPGEWNVYVDTAGIWTQWLPAVLHPTDGQTIKGRQSVDFYVAKGKPWRFFVQTRECDFGSLGNAYSPAGVVAPCPHINEVGNTASDDQPGILAVHFRSPQASLGIHRVNSSLVGSTCPASNTHGCYRMTFKVSRIRP